MIGLVLALHGLSAVAITAHAARVEYNWSVSNINVKMDGVNDRLAVAVNGQIPMPLAIASLGDTLVLNLRNELNEPTGLHSHGILNNGTNYYDGAGMVTECGIAPGSQMTYEIPLTQTGTYWIHGHHGSQYINGLRGPLIIVDPNGEPYKYDEDIVLTFEDWFPKASAMSMGHMTPESPNPRLLREPKPCVGCSADSGVNMVAAASPMHSSMDDKMASNTTDPTKKYPLAVINGIPGDYAPDLNFVPGRTYRVRLLNIGSSTMFRFGVEGHDMYVIEADGISTKMKKVQSVTLGIAQRVSVLIKARPTAVQNFRYHFDLFSDIFPQLEDYNPRRHMGSIMYGEELEYGPIKQMFWDEFDDLSLVPLDNGPLLQADVVHDIILSAQRTPTDLVQAYINGISFALPTVPSLFTALNHTANTRMSSTDFGPQCNAKILRHLDVVELQLLNTDTVHHPMHLHGHFFQIVERGTIGDPVSARMSSNTPMRRDTILMAPNTYAVLRFRADNPGVWMMHCHIERHMELGLSMMFVAAPEVMRERIKVPEKMKEQCRLLGIKI
ncbi:ferroxidase fet3 [Kickxella alabastrina]|uniref:Ferroxidase fet3 n=1 Tax=Kickxella alabastrina TaxID=61397 RepID=A0ACC1IUB0_9FUNG|nr:ferroxidase fet3 [Kickxella alabastrina]